MADAFAVLLSQSQRSTKKQRKSEPKEYVTCPVCDTSVPKAFIESHTEDCLQRSERPSGATSQPVARQRSAAQDGAAASGGRAAAAGAAAGAAGAAEAAAAGGPLSTPARRLPPDEFRAVVSAGWDVALQSVPGALAAATPAPPLNAFEVLSAARAAAEPMAAQLFLEHRPGGSCVVHWRLLTGSLAAGAGSAPPGLQAAWSATVNANLPKQCRQTATAAARMAPPGGGRRSSGGSSSSSIPTGTPKLRLEVATNLPSGFGAAVDWSNPLLASNSPGSAGNHSSHPGQQQQPAGAAPAGAAPAGAVHSSSSSGGGVRWHGRSGVLISALQKSVRRGKSASATRIALELLKDAKGADALLRRLSIICLEDGVLHPQLPLVVWAMMAVGKGYVIGGHLANALLEVTHQMAAMPHRDFVADAGAASAAAAACYTPPSSWNAVDAALGGSSSQESILVKAVLIRAAYGGMAGDVDMLCAFAGIWTARFSGQTLPPPPLPPQQQPPPPGQQPGQQQQEQPDQQQPPDQQQMRQLPGRKGGADCSGAPPAASPWLLFLRQLYAQLPAPGPASAALGAAADAARVTAVKALSVPDIPVAAIDFHVDRGLTQHLVQNQQLRGALTALAASNAGVAARLAAPDDGAEGLINATLWLFRSSINHKRHMQWLYPVAQQQQQAPGANPLEAAAAAAVAAWAVPQQQQRPPSVAAMQLLGEELSAITAADAEVRQKRGVLAPVWRVVAQLADAWSRELIARHLHA